MSTKQNTSAAIYIFIENFGLVQELIAQLLVDYAGDENYGEADDTHEDHFVCFSLANALFPNMKLHTGLLFHPPGSHGINIVDNPFENTLRGESWHRGHRVPD